MKFQTIGSTNVHGSMFGASPTCIWNPWCFCPNKEENALKAKLRRLCEPKKGGRLQVPQWLHDEWRNGDHLVLAKQYAACGFDKAIIFPQKTCFLLAKCPHVDVASNFGSLSSPLSRLPNLSWQEQFIKHRTLTHKKEKKEVNDKSVGWYTKEDMQKVLKWNAKLPRI